MKKYLVFLLLIFASFAQARSTVVVVGQAPAAASCTGNFGNTGETETGNTYMAAGDILVQRIDLSSCGNGNPTSVNILAKAWTTTSLEVIPVIYSDDPTGGPSSQPWPDALLWQGTAVYEYQAGDPMLWVTQDPDYTISANYVWVGLQIEGSGTRINNTGATGAASVEITGTTFGSPPASWGSSGTERTINNSIYIGF